MSDVPESTDLIQVESVQFRAAASESTMTLIAGDLNYAVTRTIQNKNILLKTVTFTTSGSWLAPANLAGGFILAVGAGGAGSGGNTGSSGGSGVTAQGGGGVSYSTIIAIVIPGNTYSYVIGGGGPAQASTGADGNGGSGTTFNGLLVCSGSAGGAGTIIFAPVGSTALALAQSAAQGLAGEGSGGAKSGRASTGGGGGGGGNALTGGNAGNPSSAGADGILKLVWFENPTVLLP